MSNRPFQEDYAEPHVVEEFVDKTDLLVGKVYELQDMKHWKFDAAENSWHPGACCKFDEKRQEVSLLKGTSRQPHKRKYAYVQVNPDNENGLRKNTCFFLNSLYPFRSRLIELLHHDHLMGKVI